MKNIMSEKKDFTLFNKTSSGASKLALFIMGIILGLVSSTLFGYMCGNYNATGNYQYYDWLLFVAIFLLVLTGELIGIYFGAYEEFHLLKKKELLEKENNEKKSIVKDENEKNNSLVAKNKEVVIKEKKSVNSKKNVTNKDNAKKTKDIKKKSNNSKNKTNSISKGKKIKE